jgi:hypothetical protein
MLKRFAGVWVAYWSIVALLPVYSLYPAISAAFCLQATFVLLVAFSYLIVLSASSISQMPAVNSAPILGASKLIEVSLVLALLGFGALLYDKIYVQGIDYSHGLAAAREAWKVLGEERGGAPSSLFSVFGYLVGSTYFVAAVLAISQSSFISPSRRFWTLFASVIFLLGNAALTGGRSNILLFAVFVAGAFATRRGLHLQNFVTSSFQRYGLRLFIFGGVAYILYIFYQRAAYSELSPAAYALGFLPHLGLETYPWFAEQVNQSVLGGLAAMLVLAAAYLTHSFATVAAIIDAPSEDKVVVFLLVKQLLYKLGLTTRPDGNWFLAGRFPSAPGALWHQFGPIGFFAFSLLLGAGSAIAKIWAARRPRALVAIGTYVSAETILMLSPALLAWELLAFPFIVAAFCILAIVGRLLRGFSLLRRSHAS